VAGPLTQTIRLRWRPVLRFYEERVPLLRELEKRGLLQGFRLHDEVADGQLTEWRWLSIWPSGVTLNVLDDVGDLSQSWSLIETICDRLGPLHFSHARASYQHVAALPLSFDEAVERGQQRLHRHLSTSDVLLGDWALLADIDVLGPPAAKGQIEFGIVRKSELQDRLSRGVGRGPGLPHLGTREWPLDRFKDASLYADSDLTCPAEDGREAVFLSDAAEFWSASRTQMTTLVGELTAKLAEKQNGGA
jgi:hypothetical protein